MYNRMCYTHYVGYSQTRIQDFVKGRGSNKNKKGTFPAELPRTHVEVISEYTLAIHVQFDLYMYARI